MKDTIAAKMNEYSKATNPTALFAIYLLDYTNRHGKLPDSDDMLSMLCFILQFFKMAAMEGKDEEDVKKFNQMIAKELGLDCYE